jgi:high-affinity iron transporter
MQKAGKKVLILALIFFIVSSLYTGFSASAAQEQDNLDDLYIEVGDALINASDEKWDLATKNIASFQKSWTNMQVTDNRTADRVTESLQTVTKSLNDPEKDPAQIRKQLSALSNALAAYDKEANPVEQEHDKKKIKQLLPIIDEAEAIVNKSDWKQAKTAYNQLLTKWNENETIVRGQNVAAYGQIETQLAFIRIGLSQTPPDKHKTLTGIKDLKTAVNDFLNGNIAEQTANKSYTLDDAVKLLNQSSKAMLAKDVDQAAEYLNQYLLIWPVVEGKVRTSDPGLYGEIENNIPKAISLLQSQKKDITKANTIVTDLAARLQLIAAKTGYTFVDAMLVLLREGLEAILIIAGLLTFLKKTNNSRHQAWIWTGAAAGIAMSALLAVGMNLFLSNITAAESREYLEGIIGLVAVVMMLTVGVWLHKKSNVNQWDHYVKQNIGKALARGSLFSMAALSFLSIFREGAETIIFYAGMAPSMKVNQLILGIGIAIIMLFVLGFIIIRYSSKIPLRPFFITATFLIYILAFKMIGASVHALQIANTLPVHYISQLPFIPFIGVYPTAETIGPQAGLLLIILAAGYYVKKSANPKATAEME